MEYPYLPKGRTLILIKSENRFMCEATKLLESSGCRKQPTAAVVVIKGRIVGKGSNAGKLVDVCPRVVANCLTGTGYEFCKSVCEQVGHAEVVAIKDALSRGEDLRGASLYLDGHWWACKSCWDEILKAGISRVYVRRDSVELYKK
jgi:deoxycytidylate deaminase